MGHRLPGGLDELHRGLFGEPFELEERHARTEGGTLGRDRDDHAATRADGFLQCGGRLSAHVDERAPARVDVDAGGAGRNALPLRLTATAVDLVEESRVDLELRRGSLVLFGQAAAGALV